MSLVRETCFKCGVAFGMAEETYKTLRQSGATFHCPFGHPQVYVQGPSEADKLRQERDRLKQNLAYKDDQIRREREAKEAAQRRASAMRGQVTKLKNRAANGVCPCCNRTFANLARHMAGKHPGFMAEAVEPEVTLQ